MAQAALYQILEQIKTLKPDELHQVSQAIQQQFSPQTETQKRAAFHQALLASGLVKEIKTPPANVPEPSAIVISDKPLSETIIKERR